MKSNIKFFLGANSEKGFISYFEQLQGKCNDLRLLILKGGPGCGKSSLMKKVCEYAKKRGNKIILIPCASDPLSLDAFIDVTEGFAMLDGTSPHVTDPALPGARQHLFNMGEGWDLKKLSENESEISALTDYISHCHKEAGAYIKSAAVLLRENMQHASSFMNKKEIYGFADEIIKSLPDSGCGREYTALLDAVSVGERVFFDETLSEATGIYALKDEWGAGADFLMKLIKDGAAKKGVSVINCPSSIIPALTEHLIVGDFEVVFTTEKRYCNKEKSDIVVENFYSGIYDEKEMKNRAEISSLLLDKASKRVEKAKLLHDKLEAYYKEAMDFSIIDLFYDKILKTFY